MSEPASPTAPFYVTGGTLKPGAPSYVERQADTDLIESLQAGEFCYVLTARQMGKSSLMARTAKRLEEDGVCTAIVDLSQIGTERGAQAATQWYFGIAHEIHRQLQITEPLRPWWQERADLPPVQRLTGFFRDVVLGHCLGRVVVFVDEIDSTIGLPFADDFFAALRACFNARATDPPFERLTFALFGVATPDQLIRDQARTPFNIGRRIDLTDFTMDEAKKLAAGLHSDPLEASRRLDRVLYWTGGHPYLTQAVCRTVRERGENSESGPIEGAIDPWVEELFLSSRAQREETNLKHARARMQQPSPEKRRLLRLYLGIRQGKIVPDQPTSPLFARLKLTGVVKTLENGRLAVRNRIYEAVFTPHWAKSATPVDRGRQVAWATVASSLSLALAWYGVFKPRQAEETFRAAIQDDAYHSADAAYNDLRRNPFYRSRATDLLQEFWEKRGFRESLAGKRDESILSFLQALDVKENQNLRKIVANRVGSDYESLSHTLRVPAHVGLVALGSDGHTALLVEAGQLIWLWDTRTGKPTAGPFVQSSRVNSVTLSQDGRRILIGCEDNSARLLDARSGRLIVQPLVHRGAVHSVALSPDGLSALTGSWDRTAQIWDTRSGKPIGHPLAHRGFVTSVAFSPDGRTALTGSEDKTAQLWDTRTGKPTTSPLIHQAWVSAVAFSPDGHTVATGAQDNTARLWDAFSGKPIAPPLMHHGHITAVAFGSDGRTVLTGTEDNTAQLWDVRSGNPIAPTLLHEAAVEATAFDGHTILTVFGDNSVRVWELRPKKWSPSPSIGQDPVSATAFSSDGRTLLLRVGPSGSWRVFGDHSVQLLDVEFGKLSAPRLLSTDVSAVALSPDGRTVLTGAEDGTVQLWNIRSGQPAAPPLIHHSGVTAVAFSPDGRTALTGSIDFTARLWDTHSGEPSIPPLIHGGRVSSVAFSPNGRILLTVSKDNTARLWDGRSGRLIVPPLVHKGGVSSGVFSPDGQTVLTWSEETNETASLWEVRSGKLLAQSKIEDPRRLPLFQKYRLVLGTDIPEIKTLASYGPDGRRFFVASGYWLDTYSWDGQRAVPQGRQLLHGFWTGGYRFSSSCESCLEVTLGDTGNSLHIETINLDVPNDPPIQGDPKRLLDEWQRRLGLKFDKDMNLVPRYGPE
jgi:WD40 repeat protein